MRALLAKIAVGLTAAMGIAASVFGAISKVKKDTKKEVVTEIENKELKEEVKIAETTGKIKDEVQNTNPVSPDPGSLVRRMRDKYGRSKSNN